MTNGDSPTITFDAFTLSLGTAVFVSLGDIENPATGKKELNLVAAKQNIDILSLLEEKTKGNLSDAEAKILGDTLYQSRMRYLSVKGENTQPTES